MENMEKLCTALMLIFAMVVATCLTFVTVSKEPPYNSVSVVKGHVVLRPSGCPPFMEPTFVIKIAGGHYKCIRDMYILSARNGAYSILESTYPYNFSKLILDLEYNCSRICYIFTLEKLKQIIHINVRGSGELHIYAFCRKNMLYLCENGVCKLVSNSCRMKILVGCLYELGNCSVKIVRLLVFLRKI